MIIFVGGTGTDVGKTWVLAELLTELQARGRRVEARKAAQSFAPAELGYTDAEILAAATGDEPIRVCREHRWYPTPMAPPMAADALGLPPFTIADLAREIAPASDGTITFVEGAGGPRSPLASDGDNVDLARALGAGCAILVADAGLGTINSVRMSVDALTGFDTLVQLNRFVPGDDLHLRNRDWLTGAGYEVLVAATDLADAVEARLP
jgi:dethiobiotin synthetase